MGNYYYSFIKQKKRTKAYYCFPLFCTKNRKTLLNTASLFDKLQFYNFLLNLIILLFYFKKQKCSHSPLLSLYLFFFSFSKSIIISNCLYIYFFCFLKLLFAALFLICISPTNPTLLTKNIYIVVF